MKKNRVKCNTCGRRIRFVYSNGRYIPCDYEPRYVVPTESGDVYFRGNGTKIVGREDRDGYLVYKPHSCV